MTMQAIELFEEITVDLVTEMDWEDNEELFIPSGLMMYEEEMACEGQNPDDSVSDYVAWWSDGEDSRFEDN